MFEADLDCLEKKDTSLSTEKPQSSSRRQLLLLASLPLLVACQNAKTNSYTETKQTPDGPMTLLLPDIKQHGKGTLTVKFNPGIIIPESSLISGLRNTLLQAELIIALDSNGLLFIQGLVSNNRSNKDQQHRVISTTGLDFNEANIFGMSWHNWKLSEFLVNNRGPIKLPQPTSNPIKI